MDARERVITAFDHRKPDRIPRYEVFFTEYADACRQAHGLDASANVYDYYTKVDIGGVMGMQAGPLTCLERTDETGGDTYYVTDSWGRRQRHSHSGYFFEVLEVALADKQALDGLVFEDPWDDARQRLYRERAAEARDRFATVTGVMGLFMSSYYMRGELDLLIDMKEDEAFCRALADRLAGFLAPVGDQGMTYTDTWDTAIWVYDELGNNHSSVMSPDTFERVYLEPYRAMIGQWKSRGAKQVILHCDGNCLPLVELLIEAGFTGIQGNNPSAGMTVPAMKARYGNRLVLVGGMCNIHVLTHGSHDEIRRQAESIVDVAKDGGVVIGTHSIDVDVPVAQYDYYCSVLEELDERW